MNVVFGAAAAAFAERPGAGLFTAAAEISGREVRASLDHRGPPALYLGSAGDGGSIVGQAAAGKVALTYIGAITAPAAGWPGAGSPLDRPDVTARFLLDRYKAAGPNFLDGINGQYAVAVVDAERGTALLATDPWGGRSWFVAEADGRLAYSSHLLTLAKSLGPALRIDRSLEDFFLVHGFYPFGRTPYAGIRTLAPGTLLQWSADGAESMPLKPIDPWPGVAEEVAGLRTEDAVVEALFEAMVRATREQLPSVPQRVAVLLGGFDSALVASVIHRLGYEVETYSFHYEDPGYNQPHTDTLAKYLGIRHHWIQIDRGMVEQGLREFSRVFNQPTNWPNYVIQTARLCQQIGSDGIRHCYSGDGCDAVFMGYPGTYLRARVFDALPTLPPQLHRALMRLAARPRLERWLGHPYRVLLGMLRGLGSAQPARGYLSFHILDELSLQQLRRDGVPAERRSVEELVHELSAPFAALPTLRLAYQGKAAVSPNRNKLIGSSDLAGITILAPYMHAGLRKFALSLPEDLLRPSDRARSTVTGKYILMKMAERKRLLPAEVIHQPKMAAVDGPIDEWYAGPLRGMLGELMRGLPFEYDQAYVERLLDLKASEGLFKRYVMTDKVISHAASLLATYATFTGAAVR
jgi:asparagine synthetase B (glutamine-hydrolysing)